MKKMVFLLGAFVLSLAMFTGCGDGSVTEEATQPSADEEAEYDSAMDDSIESNTADGSGGDYPAGSPDDSGN